MIIIIKVLDYDWNFSLAERSESVTYEEENSKYECKSYDDVNDIETYCNTDIDCLKIAKFSCDNKDDCFGFSWGTNKGIIKLCKDLNMKERKDSSFKSRMKSSARNSII